jgi:hypothetical protein
VARLGEAAFTDSERTERCETPNGLLLPFIRHSFTVGEPGAR